jgi:hypothetical protein
VRELQDWQRDLSDNYGYPLVWWEREQLRAVLASDRYLGALYDPRSGHLQPLAYARGLARAAGSLGVQLYEHSPVRELVRGAKPLLRGAEGEVEADFVVLAGNALMEGIAPELESRVMPVGTYIGATAPLGAERAHALIGNGMAAADVNWALDYFRIGADTRLLFGGRASYSTLPPPNLRATMQRRMRRVFPQLREEPIERVWGGLIDISRNRAPHWGRLGATCTSRRDSPDTAWPRPDWPDASSPKRSAARPGGSMPSRRSRTWRFRAGACCARRCWSPAWRPSSCATRSGERKSPASRGFSRSDASVSRPSAFAGAPSAPARRACVRRSGALPGAPGRSRRRCRRSSRRCRRRCA